MCTVLFAGAACSEDDPSSDKTYEKGDFYNENGIRGVIFKVSEDGSHGLIVSLDESEAEAWATGFPAATGADSQSDVKANMEAIGAIADWQMKFPAFAWCEMKNAAGVKGWYLPAYDELGCLYETYAAGKDAFNKTLADNGGTAIAPTGESPYYWSSSENAIKASEAAAFGLSGGNYLFRAKTVLCRVRAIHEF